VTVLKANAQCIAKASQCSAAGLTGGEGRKKGISFVTGEASALELEPAWDVLVSGHGHFN
jgi:hypothetical protein